MTIDAHARMSDPISSHVTVASIAKDGSIKDLIMKAAQWKANTAASWEWADDYSPAFCDTYLWQWIETFTGRRFQRNVIARARGLMVQEGLLVGVGSKMYEGRSLEHYTIAPPQGALF